MHRHRLTHGMGIIRGHNAALAHTFDLDVHIQQAGTISGNINQRTHGNQTHVGPGIDANLTPDAGVCHIDAPIPAEGVARLANLVERVMLGVRVVAAGLLHAVGFTHRRGEGDGQFVGSLSQQFAYVPTVGAVEVLGGGHRASVQRDVGDGVEAVGHQVVAIGAVVVPVETAGETPVDVADPLLIVLVGAVERIGDQSCIQQVQGRLSRHGCRNADGKRFTQRFWGGFWVDGRQRPSVAQRSECAGNVRHGKFLCTKKRGHAAMTVSTRPLIMEKVQFSRVYSLTAPAAMPL